MSRGLSTCSRCEGAECRHCNYRGECNPTPAYDVLFDKMALRLGSRAAREALEVMGDLPRDLMAWTEEENWLSSTPFVRVAGTEPHTVDVAWNHERPDGKPLWSVTV